jgi:tRNA (guanine-N7-)-methyltransferase
VPVQVGLELRLKVSEYVRDRIECLRLDQPGQFENIACLRSNAMKHLPCFFRCVGPLSCCCVV